MFFRVLSFLVIVFFTGSLWAAPGDFDSTFGGGDGWTSTGFESSHAIDAANSLIQQMDGKLVVAGVSNSDVAIVRYAIDGSLDTTFNGTGKLTTDFSGEYDSASSVIQQADGKLVVAGASSSNFALVRYNSDGSLDPTFNGTGKLTTTVGTLGGAASSVIQQVDGKLVVAGYSNNGSDDDFSLVRYNSDGSLDTSFNGTGKLVTAIGASTDQANSVIQQEDGKLVVAGSSHNGSNYDFALVRYNSDGSLDTSFNGTGKLTTAIGVSNDYGGSLIQQMDGKLVLAGIIHTSSSFGAPIDIGLARYNSDGSLDATFSDDGKLITDFGSESAYSVIQQMDGKLVVAGRKNKGGLQNDFELVRYNSDGSLDTSFNGTGELTVAVSTGNNAAYELIQQADGKLVAAGFSGGDFALIRCNTDGSLDTTFSDDGMLSTAFFKSTDGAESLIQQMDGKLVAAGFSDNSGNRDFALVRYNSDGSLDSSFNGTGKLVTAIGASTDQANSVIQQADGKLVAAGSSNNGSNDDFALVRYNSNGTLDTTFNGTGKLTTAIGTSTEQTLSVVQQSDGKLVAAGWSYVGSNYDFALVRYNSNGTLDTTFNGTGKLTTAIGASTDQVNSVIQQADGKLVAAGFSDNSGNRDFALVRYNSDGSLDTSFNGTGKLTTAIGASTDQANSVIQQADGKLVVAGYSYNIDNNFDFALVRYNSDGSLDTTFNGTGKLIVAIGASDDYANSLIQQADGKLVAAGYSHNGSNDDFALVRYNGDGSLDTTFNGTGKLSAAIGAAYDYANSLLQQPDGKLVVGGYSTGMPTSQEFVVARFESGQPDTDDDGYVDGLDTDDDNDGIVDISDAFPLDASESADTDGDGIGNNADTTPNGDTDSDGVDNLSDNCVSVSNADQLNTDGDEQGNACDGDDDNDGVADISDAFPLDASESIDTDGDGIGNNADNCIAVSNSSQTDTDNDGAGDACDTTPNGDTDGDGIDNASDNCVAVSNANQLDHDSDGSGDACDEAVPLPDDVVGANAGAKAGSAVAFAGDVNGDGYGDYVVGAPGYDIPAVPPMKKINAAGRAEVISGKDGTVLMFVNGIAANDAMGSAVAGNADINNDGFADVLVGAPFADGDTKDVGSVMVLFGPNGVAGPPLFGEQKKSAFGAALALGDLDGDGYAEMIVGVPRMDIPGAGAKNRLVDAGTVKIFDHNGALVQQHYGTAAKDYFGSSVAVGDINHDGNPDVIVGSPNADDVLNNRIDAGRVAVFSSRTDHVLLDSYGASAKSMFGAAVAAGDVNGDGVADVLVGAPADKNGTAKNSGSITVLSGSDGARLTKRLGAAANAGHGNSVATGDVNGDGIADIVAGSWRDKTLQSPVIQHAGSVFVRSGGSYAMLGMLYGETAYDYFGTSVSVGDINSDGKADVIIGIPGSNAVLQGAGTVKDAGMVTVLSGAGL